MSSAGFAHHGGRLGAARVAYSQAPQPWIDLSTGINPRSYPAPRARGVTLNRLPDTGELSRLEAVAAGAFGVADSQRVVATGGTEPALRLLPYVLGVVARAGGGAVGGARAAVDVGAGGGASGVGIAAAVVAGPTYGSHADGWAQAGVPSRVVADTELEGAIGDRTAVIVVNPNNPDGRVIGRERLRQLHDLVASRGGVLVVDEAFAEVTPQASVADIAGTSEAEHLVVLRSFGKFYGLAGLRLGFVVGSPLVAARVRGVIGDWPVSVDALAAGLAAYADHPWADRMRLQLAAAARRLDGLLSRHGFEVVGGTSLYRLVRAGDAPVRFERLAAAGILTRPFQHDATLLRFGLPGAPEGWRRLTEALAGFSRES
ncbi:MAG TPA: aminotransferase class I/II-fold pyridoxal phosphate-dependent enzyme [Steroidobacteraceae bacterium]|nr:aminotransferase class I/II-fold pyridoxal phosphate-dependent enzyme [Steroidobacteraceae bacterium]